MRLHEAPEHHEADRKVKGGGVADVAGNAGEARVEHQNADRFAVGGESAMDYGRGAGRLQLLGLPGAGIFARSRMIASSSSQAAWSRGALTDACSNRSIPCRMRSASVTPSSLARRFSS